MRYATFLGHAIFVIHFILALFFVLERSLYSDSAYFIFNIINDQSFAVGAERYASVLPQLLPILAVKLNASLSTVLYLFSISYIVFYYILFHIVVYRLKNPPIGLAIALSLFFCVEHNYFMPIFEMTQAIAVGFVLYALLDYHYSPKRLNQVLFVTLFYALVAFCFMSHPAAVFSILFIIAFIIIDKKRYTDLKLYGGIVFLFALIIGKSMLIESDSYEGSFMNELKNFKALLPNLLNLYSTKFFLSRFMSLYLFAFVLGAWLLWGYYTKREFLKTFLVLATVGGFLIFSFLLFHAGDSDMMMERVFIQLSIFIFIPFMKDFYIENIPQLAIKVFFILAVVLATSRVWSRGMMYRERVEYIAAIVATQSTNTQAKFIIPKKSLNENIVLVPWAFAVETLLYSSLDGPSKSKTFFLTENIETLKYDKEDKDLFLAVTFWQNWKASDLNKNYFALPNQVYLELK